MNDTTFNAAASATLKFYGYNEEEQYSLATIDSIEFNKLPTSPEILNAGMRWHFNVVEHYRTMLRDEFGILSLESRLEELNVQDDDNVHMSVYTPRLLALIAAAIEQELELVSGVLLFADNGDLCIIHNAADADKLAQLDDKKDYILARADYLGALDLVQIWTSKKKDEKAA